MFCPKCGAEYIDGISRCADCEVDLVKQKPDEQRPEYVNFVTVYETGNPAIISIAKSILDSADIPYYMKGEGVQDLFGGGRIGTGFNPLVGPVQIQVDEKQVSVARELLSELDSSEVENVADYSDDDEAGTDPSPQDHSQPLFPKPFVVGLLLGAIITGIGFSYYIYSLNHRSGFVDYDWNNDGKPDLVYQYENGKIVEMTQDRNLDGEIDSRVTYENDQPARGESDDNFDGVFESEIFYKNGAINRIEIDVNHNAEPDIIEYFTNEVLDEILYIFDKDHSTWKETKYVGGVMREERIDTDFDGKFDVRNVYNSSGRMISTKKIH